MTTRPSAVTGICLIAAAQAIGTALLALLYPDVFGTEWRKGTVSAAPSVITSTCLLAAAIGLWRMRRWGLLLYVVYVAVGWVIVFRRDGQPGQVLGLTLHTFACVGSLLLWSRMRWSGRRDKMAPDTGQPE